MGYEGNRGASEEFDTFYNALENVKYQRKLQESIFIMWEQNAKVCMEQNGKMIIDQITKAETNVFIGAQRMTK